MQVFLWVTLVVRSLVEGLENEDEMKTLQKRLSALPAGLEPLYKRMVEQIDPFYHTQAARIFRMVQSAAQPLSPLAISFAEDKPSDALLEQSLLSGAEITEQHRKVAKRLKARTAGLIEIRSVTPGVVIDTPSSDSHSEEYDTMPWPSWIQYLHLTVKEFLLSDNVPTWLATKLSETAADTHIDIVACCLRQIRATRSLELYDYFHTPSYSYGRCMSYYETTAEGTVFMIISHGLELEWTTKSSLLPYLEALDDLVMAQAHAGYEKDELSYPHWTLGRYRDWLEPREWRSDYVSYLITIGMTRSVIDKFVRGYDPATKPGRPLLHYATRRLAPHFAIRDIERDTVDPIMVEELLKRKCDPNQRFQSVGTGRIRDETNTVWEAALLQVYVRFGGDWLVTRETDAYTEEVEKNSKAMRNLKLRWLKTIKLFLDFGADPAQVVNRAGHTSPRWPCEETMISGLWIFDRVFADFHDPLVSSVRERFVSKDSTEVGKT